MVLNSSIIAGFSLLLLAEFMELRGKRAFKALRSLGYSLVIAALALYAYPAIEAILRTPVMGSPSQNGLTNEAQTKAAVFLSTHPNLFCILFALGIGSAAMLIWTVFFELALGKKKLRAEATNTVSWGSYGICRHPGFWWLTLFMLCLGILRGFFSSVLSSFLVIFFNFLLIEVQDRHSFPKLFKGYEAYRKKVPFLIPRCIKRGIFRQ
jgi:protein-S-isoprenylcysteine O-methyltransferase Ste14